MFDVFLELSPLAVGVKFTCMWKGHDDPVVFLLLYLVVAIHLTARHLLSPEVSRAPLTKLRFRWHLEHLRIVLSCLPVSAVAVEFVVFFSVAQKSARHDRK
jgi:hypothetical protein